MTQGLETGPLACRGPVHFSSTWNRAGQLWHRKSCPDTLQCSGSSRVFTRRQTSWIDPQGLSLSLSFILSESLPVLLSGGRHLWFSSSTLLFIKELARCYRYVILNLSEDTNDHHFFFCFLYHLYFFWVHVFLFHLVFLFLCVASLKCPVTLSCPFMGTLMKEQ